MKPTKILMFILFLAPFILCAEPGLTEAEKKAGFKSIFNGKDLTGWECLDDNTWHVKDGAICPKESKIKNWVVWRGAQPADFELRLKAERVRGLTQSDPEDPIGEGLPNPLIVDQLEGERCLTDPTQPLQSDLGRRSGDAD